MFSGIAITTSSIYSAHRIRVATNCDRRTIPVVIRNENGGGAHPDRTLTLDGPRSLGNCIRCWLGRFYERIYRSVVHDSEEFR